jgi:ABC-2 type transport system permease protein
MTEIVLGKYLGVLAFLLAMIAMLTLMPLSLLGGGGLDMGHLAAILLAALLLSASFAATGLLMSTLTQYPAVAAISSMGVLLLLLLLGWVGNPVTEDGSPNLLATLSILTHYGNLLQGVVSSADLSYFLLLILGMLVLSIRRLDADRVQG